jgi:hypothetical protein
VLAVKFGRLLRGVLHDLLTTVDHYAGTHVTTEGAAVAYLDLSLEDVVTVYSKWHTDHDLSTAFFAAAVAAKRLARRHQYSSLCTDPANPAKIPAALRVHQCRPPWSCRC